MRGSLTIGLNLSLISLRTPLAMFSRRLARCKVYESEADTVCDDQATVLFHMRVSCQAQVAEQEYSKRDDVSLEDVSLSLGQA